MPDNRRPLIINMMLFDKPRGLSLTDLEEAQKSAEAENQITVTKHSSDQDNAFIAKWKDKYFAIMDIGQPVPQEIFNNVLQFGFGLENGQKIVEEQKAHIIVTNVVQADNLEDAILNAVGITEITDMISHIQKPIGHYWSHADTLSNQDQFEKGVAGVREALTQQTEDKNSAASHLPHTMWTGFRLIGTDTNKIGAKTIGLNVFTGYELEIVPIDWPPVELAKRIYGTVQYLLNNGSVLEDGQTLGVTEDEHFRLHWHQGGEGLAPRFFLKLEAN